MNILTECGYHIDLTQCASTGSASNLIYVSPRSGKAVSREAGDKYKNSLLVLPEFILLGTEPKDRYEIDKANILIEYFLKRYLVNNQQTLNSRNIFYELIRSSL
jgi:DNA repair protein RecO (recombination protein O)